MEQEDDFDKIYKGEISKSGAAILPSKRVRKIPEKIAVVAIEKNTEDKIMKKRKIRSRAIKKTQYQLKKKTNKLKIILEQKKKFFMKKTVSVAPMMDCTDRHDRFFLRLISKNVMLYSEMVATKSAIHGDRNKILSFSPEEKPLALTSWRIR